MAKIRVPALRRRFPPEVIAIGASTGGTEAIRAILEVLPPDCPGILVVQHMPVQFTRAFADRLNSLCALRVKEAEDGDRNLPGQVLIAPGDRHMRLVCEAGHVRVRLGDDPPVNRHRPSVDVLFLSCAASVGPRSLGILLTGMGKDGARGLLQMRTVGARTLVQDESTSIVFGMPKAAIHLGAAEQVLPLHQISEAVVSLSRAR